ncbi:MAG: hypothetical protein A2W93_03420 [Bacteroidetes bacterium GWF2_43_63]|nr:MAG: hypothetical protein A2W94_09420 [Bacteroidetes bacterium GWE2_42_42]OFY53707.1 MAG: hypothetical protein A2W93_03420 [Bacteroidetes bacterium GWF2_43_63]HBG70944.1 hypothetical protein [Bacteroidales bacterium]HCB62965.1 hypothetical protein [Bacteroidales bacterium]HCY24271.1 hypothetical protein [Bacteroidales bacterium]
MKKTHIFLIALLALFSSCEDMVTNVDVPASESHYVIHSYLSPEDTAVIVYVDRSEPVFGDSDNDTSWISQAHVFVNGIELSRVSDYNIKFLIPADSLPIVAGETYTVSLQIGTENVCSGSCTVPLIRNESLLYKGIDSVENQGYDGFTYYDYYILYSFTDIATVENFYRIAAEFNYVDPYSSDTAVYTIYPESVQFIKDVLFSGSEYSDRILVGGSETLSGITGLKLFLYTSDNNYYHYHRAILSQTDDPFSEPVIVPTNIDNGLGCVAGYRKYVLNVF